MRRKAFVQQPLSFSLQELSPSGRTWSLEIPQALFEDGARGTVDAPSHLCKDVFWKGEISSQGALFRLRGNWHVELIRHCVRCNVAFPLLMEGECDRHFRIGVESQQDDSDGCEWLEAPGYIDLVDLLREEVWLAWKPMVICSESCKGLCQQCGENLNRDECKCSQDGDDNPFAALRQIRFDT
jgi:uncharacterized protein